MKRLTILAMAVGLMMAIAVPASADATVREAAGTTTFTLNPLCTPGVDCAFDPETEVFTIELFNPATKTGTFDGNQLLIADFLLDITDGTFQMIGTVVFNGTVRGCGRGTVVFDAYGEGHLDETGTAVFLVNTETVNPVGTTLPITGVLNSPGALPTDPETNIGTSDYTGEFVCDRSR